MAPRVRFLARRMGEISMRSVLLCGWLVVVVAFGALVDVVPAKSAVAPSPDTLIAIALRRAPSLAALRARVQAARERVRPAGALPDPTLELMLQDVGFPRWTVGEEDMSMIGPQLSQGIPFPGKRGARRRVAEAEVVVQEHELEHLRRRVAQDLRTGYARLYALDRERRSLVAGRELMSLLAETVRARYSSGSADAEAALKARLVVARLEERLDDLVMERAGVAAGIEALIDDKSSMVQDEVVSLPEVSVPPLPWAPVIAEGSVEVVVQRAQIEVAERRLRAAGIERWPDLMAGAGVGLRGDRDPVVTLKLGLDLPLWGGSKQGPLVRAAAQEVVAARASLRQAEAASRAEAARLEAQWLRSAQQIARYSDTLVPQSSLTFDAARANYLAGRGDFAAVIDDLDLWLAARSGLAAREAERYTTWAALQTVLGPHEPATEGSEAR